MKLLVLAPVLAVLSLAAVPARADAVVGQAAPALVATTLDGKNVDIASLKGKVVAVHFWATWCLPCREEMPALEAVYRHLHGKGFEVLAISADRPRARGDVDQVMHFYSYPAAMLSGVTKNDFGTLTAVPVTYLIGKDGVVTDILTPPAAPLIEQALGSRVQELLDAKTDAKTEAKPETKTDAKS